MEADVHYRFTFCITNVFLALVFKRKELKKYRFENYYMSLKVFTFCKSANCPSSQDLLKFQKNEISVKEREMISRHFAVCEFCAAEVEFYAHYPPTKNEKITKTEIPAPLFELASALLGNRHKDFSLLNQLLHQSEGVKI